MRHPLHAAAALIAACSCASVLAAQDPMIPRNPVLFLEKAYFSLGSPTGKNLLFEGQPTVHYFFWNGLGDLVWQKRGGWAFAVPVSALLQVRMTNEFSQPVKTPSYRIRPLHAQAVRLWRPASAPLTFAMLEFGASPFTHYSNGQKGCTFDGFSFDAALKACRVSDPPLAARRVANTENGDFSTSYLSADVHYRHGRLRGIDDPVVASWTIGGELQVHPLEIKPGGMNGEQAREWGQHQASVMFEVERRVGGRIPGVLRVAGDYTYRTGVRAERRTDSGQVELSYLPDWGQQIGFYIRQHLGSDYYNINFQDRRPFTAIGVMWDVGRLDKLNTALPP